MDFLYQDPYPILKDDTEYKKLTSDYVKVEQLGDREILVVDPKGLELLAQDGTVAISSLRFPTKKESVRLVSLDGELRIKELRIWEIK